VLEPIGDTLLVVVVVIFLCLGSFRSVLVPVVAIPVLLIGAVFLMQAFGFTVNILTLLSIVLSVGFVVVDAIVLVENVERHLAEGKSPLDAALLGTRELVGPVIAMTVTLTAVYLPIGLQGGLTGSLFRELAFAKDLQMKALQSGMFFFPTLIDVKIDQPQSESVIDKDKVAALELNLGQIGMDLGGMVGGDHVQPESIL
jgi:multidrug efflux pump subunit AcrB